MQSRVVTPSARFGAMAVLLALFTASVFAFLFGGCSTGSGTCIGIGGALTSGPVCKEDWTADECREWDQMEVNSADWTFNPWASCEDLGYTERCSDGSYREPGDC